MVYDVLIDDTIYIGITYAELISLPLKPTSRLRRDSSDWMKAADCVELSHILAHQSNINPAPRPQEQARPTSIHNELNAVNCDNYSNTMVPIAYDTAQSSSHIQNEDVEEEQIFIPNAEYFKCKQKRKAAIIGVCTLGLAGLSLMGVINIWKSDLFAGTSFSSNAGIGFVLKCLSFCLLSTLLAIPYFIYSVIALIYYTIRLKTLRN